MVKKPASLQKKPLAILPVSAHFLLVWAFSTSLLLHGQELGNQHLKSDIRKDMCFIWKWITLLLYTHIFIYKLPLPNEAPWTLGGTLFFFGANRGVFLAGQVDFFFLPVPRQISLFLESGLLFRPLWGLPMVDFYFPVFRTPSFLYPTEANKIKTRIEAGKRKSSGTRDLPEFPNGH